MTLEERINSAIRSRTDLVEPWTPDLDSIRRAARTQTRRRAAVAATCVATAVAMTAIGLGGGPQDRSVPPVDRPSEERVPHPTVVPDDGVVRIPAERDKQVVLTPTVRSTMTPGSRLVESLSSDDPTYDGSGELSVVLRGHKPPSRDSYSLNASCDDAPQAFLVVTLEPRASYFDAVRCDGRGIRLNDLGGESHRQTLRAFVTEDDPRDFHRCWKEPSEGGCDDLEPLKATDAGARFALTVREERLGPVAARFDTEWPTTFLGRAAWRGRGYSLTRVAAGATGAAELSFRLDASSHERIAQATWNPTQAFLDCAESADGKVPETDCRPTFELVVDGQSFGPVRPTALPRTELYWPPSRIDPSVGWSALVPDEDHEITVRVIAGDPANVDLVVVVFEAD